MYISVMIVAPLTWASREQHTPRPKHVLIHSNNKDMKITQNDVLKE